MEVIAAPLHFKMKFSNWHRFLMARAAGKAGVAFGGVGSEHVLVAVPGMSPSAHADILQARHWSHRSCSRLPWQHGVHPGGRRHAKQGCGAGSQGARGCCSASLTTAASLSQPHSPRGAVKLRRSGAGGRFGGCLGYGRAACPWLWPGLGHLGVCGSPHCSSKERWKGTCLPVGAPSIAGAGVQGADLGTLGLCRTFPSAGGASLRHAALLRAARPCMDAAAGHMQPVQPGVGPAGTATALGPPCPSPAATFPGPAIPGPRRAALSLLQRQQAPSHEEARGDGCGSQERSAS